jgi:hypothetical protein
VPGDGFLVVLVVVPEVALEGEGGLVGALGAAGDVLGQPLHVGGEVGRQLEVGLDLGGGGRGGFEQVGRAVAGDGRGDPVRQAGGRLLLGEEGEGLLVDPGAVELHLDGPVGGGEPERLQRADLEVLRDLVGQLGIVPVVGEQAVGGPVGAP